MQCTDTSLVTSKAVLRHKVVFVQEKTTQHDPNSTIHFSYFSMSAADTDLETFFKAISKSSIVVGMCISSRGRFLISSGVKPSIRLLIAINDASLVGRVRK